MENKEQETVEQAAEKEYAYYGGSKPSPYNHLMDTNRLAFIREAIWQKEQGCFTREDMELAFQSGVNFYGQEGSQKDFDEFMRDNFPTK